MAVRPDKHHARGLKRRSALLDAAIEVVAEKGFAGATHRAIAAKAGFSPSTTMYFFESIDELLREAMRERLRQRVELIRTVTAQLDGVTTSYEVIADLAAGMIADVRTVDTIAQFDTYVSAARHPELRPYVAEMIEAFEGLAESALRAVNSPDPRRGAHTIVALLDGLSLHRAALDSDRSEAQVELRDALMHVFFAYAEPQAAAA